MNSQQTSLYIKIEKNSMVNDRHVKLSDVARMTGTDEAMIRQLKQMKIYSFPQKAKKTEYVQVMTSLKIFEMIQAQYPNVDITNEGEADFVIEYEPALQPSQTAEYAKTAVLCVLVFFGAAFTIMAFNNDISVTELFQKLYYQVMGKESTGRSAAAMKNRRRTGRPKKTTENTQQRPPDGGRCFSTLDLSRRSGYSRRYDCNERRYAP